MASRVRSIRPAPVLIAAVNRNGGGRGFSHRLAQIADRYSEILRRAYLPAFTEGEINAIREVLSGTVSEPATSIRGSLWIGIEAAIPDGIATKWQIDGPDLVRKLKKLSYPSEVRLIEEVELHRSKVTTTAKKSPEAK